MSEDGNKPKKEKKIVVGFWLRLISDFLDVIFLGLFGALLALLLKGLFYRIGEDGLWIGLCITFLYTGILQSNIGQGQSLAKKLLKIQVLRLDGSYLSLPRSFLRYTIIAVICYNPWIWMTLTSVLPFLNNSFLQSIYNCGVFFILLGVVVLVAFHPLKRGLHDFLAGSLVVRKGMYDSEKIRVLNVPSKVKKSFAIWGACCIILITASYYMIQKQRDLMPLLRELTAIQKNIEETTQFKNISVKHNWLTVRGADDTVRKTTSVNIFPFLEKAKFDDDELLLSEIRKVVGIITNSYSKIDECDYIKVQVRTGLNIGIASFYYRRDTLFSTEGGLLYK